MASPQHMSLSVKTAYHPGPANPTRNGIRPGEMVWNLPRFDDWNSVPATTKEAMGIAGGKTET